MRPYAKNKKILGWHHLGNPGLNAVKADTKLTLHHMGKLFIIYLIKIKFKIWRVTFLKSFFTIKTFWDGLPVFMQETIYHVHTEMRQEYT